MLAFGLSDLAMVSFTLICVPFQWMVTRGYIPIPIAIALKHALQAVLVLGSVMWTLERDWPWPQTGTFCLHAVASRCFYDGPVGNALFSR